MPTLPPADVSLLGAIAHGKTPEIAGLPFEPDMLESDLAQHVARGAITLHNLGRNVNMLQIMSVVGQRMSATDWMKVSPIFANGYGDVDAALAVTAVRSAYKVRKTREIVAEMDLHMEAEPAEVEQWLPDLQEKLRQLNEVGEVYDARPSTIYQDETPTIKFNCLIPELNDIIRGGYRSGMLGIYCGVSGQGKSTVLYTHACDVLIQGRTVDFFTNERTRRVVLNRILLGCSRLTEKEIETRQGSTPERQEVLLSWIRALDERLRIYDRHYKTTTMGRILKTDNADLGVLDYLMNQEGMLPAGRHDDPTGDMAYYLMQTANALMMTILTAAQMSNAHAEAFLKNDAAVPQIAYGTARPYHASNLWIGNKRGTLEGSEYMRVAKDNLANRFDTEHYLHFNNQTWLYEQAGGHSNNQAEIIL